MSIQVNLVPRSPVYVDIECSTASSESTTSFLIVKISSVVHEPRKQHEKMRYSWKSLLISGLHNEQLHVTRSNTQRHEIQKTKRLYNLLNNQVLFENNNLVKLIYQILCSKPISLLAERPTAALKMFSIAVRCLDKALTTGAPGETMGAFNM